MDIVRKHCGAYLTQQTGTIVGRWFEACANDEALGVLVAKLSRDAFLDDIPKAIAGLIEAIASGDGAYVSPASGVLNQHSQHRWKQGFNLRQLIRDWGNLNKALVIEVDRFFQQYHQDDHTSRTTIFACVASFTTEGLSESVRAFEALRQREAGGVANELQAVQDHFAEATHSRSQLLREATHDLRGGLSAIAGATAVLKFSPQPNRMFGDAMESLDRGIASVKTMLDSLLDLSRLESGQDKVHLETANIAPVLQTISAEYRAIATRKHLTLEASGVDELTVQTDPGKIRRIVQNILVNALEYTDAGRVSLSWWMEPAHDRWAICVLDTGRGIGSTCPTALAHELKSDDALSEPTSSFSGEGIGLTIVKRLCELLGATVDVASSAETGTRFTLYFPLAYATPQGVEYEPAPS